MNFLNEEQMMWRDTVHRFMEEEVTVEYIRKCDIERRFPQEGYDKIAKAGWLQVLFSEEEGGVGGSILDFAIMSEALGKYGFDFAAAIVAPAFTSKNISLFGTPEQRRKYLPAFMKGDIRFAISISEPSAGSDAAATRTRATREGEGYVLRGQKLWCSSAHVKNTVICMLVRTDPDAPKHAGLSVLLVPNDIPGVDIRKLPTMSRRATGTTEIFLDGARVPAENLLGKEGDGWKIIGANLRLERIAISASYVGNAQTVVDTALRYARQREQFGRSIFEFQVIKHMLADMQTSVDAARLLVYRAADMAARGVPCDVEASMAKLFASETLQTCSRNGMQILGGYGNLPEADMERYFREGMQCTVGGGTSQIQRTIIAKSMGR